MPSSEYIQVIVCRPYVPESSDEQGVVDFRGGENRVVRTENGSASERNLVRTGSVILEVRLIGRIPD